MGPLFWMVRGDEEWLAVWFAVPGLKARDIPAQTTVERRSGSCPEKPGLGLKARDIRGRPGLADPTEPGFGIRLSGGRIGRCAPCFWMFRVPIYRAFSPKNDNGNP